MADLSLAEQVIPKRQAAKQANASFSLQLEDSESESAPTKRRTAFNAVTVKYGKKAKTTRGRKGLEVKTRRLQSSDESGDLTFDNSGAGQNGAAETSSNEQTMRQKTKPPELGSFGKSSSDSELTPITTSDLSTPGHSPPPHTSPSKPPLRPEPPIPLVQGIVATSSSRTKRKHQEEVSRSKVWKKKELGDYVWVLIDDRSRVLDHKDSAAQDREYIWWPGKISLPLLRSGIQIPVILYGQTAFKVEVSHPTEDNIVPFENSAGEEQFLRPTYVIPSHKRLMEVTMSPRKKARRNRGELEKRWYAAVLELNAERDGNQPGTSNTQQVPSHRLNVRPLGTRDSDEETLPEVGEDIWKASLTEIPMESPRKATALSQTKGRRKGKRKTSSIPDDDCYNIIQGLEGSPWGGDDTLIPLADETLQIPGELVFASGTGLDRNYWPARILEYIPPKNKKEKEGQYKLEYLDRSAVILKRSSFYTSEEDGFATCKLGQFESSYDELGNDSETDELESPSQCRARSPTPAYPPPSAEEFCELGIRDQFVYTKPILVAILNERFPPARDRHDKFIKGGTARKSAVDSAAFRGEMDPRSVSELQKWLCNWCLRNEIVTQHIVKATGVGSNGHEMQLLVSETEEADAAASRSSQDQEKGYTGNLEEGQVGPTKETDRTGVHTSHRTVTPDRAPEQNDQSDGTDRSSISYVNPRATPPRTGPFHHDITEPQTAVPSLAMGIPGTPRQDPPESVDVPMEDATSFNQESPLSSVPDSDHDETSASVENVEQQPAKPTRDVDGTMTNLTMSKEPPDSAGASMADKIVNQNPALPELVVHDLNSILYENVKERPAESINEIVSEVPKNSTSLLGSTNEAEKEETRHSLARQYGCPAFEALTMMEKADYCLNVLLPEAIIQVLLWRKGFRITTELLAFDEEQRLHDEGMRLLQVTDWVFDVMRLRHARERCLGIGKKTNGASDSQNGERGGGRLRNVERVNYIE